MNENFMYIPNDNTQNDPFRIKLVFEPFDTWLNESTKNNSITVTKVVESTNKKVLL